MKMAKNVIFGFVLVVLVLSVLYFVSGYDAGVLRSCNSNCMTVQKEGLALCNENYSECRELCGDLTCKRVCSKEKTACVRNVGDGYDNCKKECKADAMPKCMNGTYRYGETFADGCDVCECKSNGKVSCKREAFCNKDVAVSESDCEAGNGLYQALCNGPYFGIYCSQQEFCICNGDNNYGCPEGYECLTDFVSPNRRKTLEGWKTLLGFPLGDIGICGR